MVVQSQKCFKWHTCTVVIPLNSGITVHVTSITFTVFKLDRKNRSNTVTISGDPVNINMDCLASNDRLKDIIGYQQLLFESYYVLV